MSIFVASNVKYAVMKKLCLILVAFLAFSCSEVVPFHVPCIHERMDTLIQPGVPYHFGDEESEIVVGIDSEHTHIGPINAERVVCPKGAVWNLSSEFVYLIRNNAELKQITDAKFPGIDFSKNSLVVVLVERAYPILRVNTMMNGCEVCDDIEVYIESYIGYPKETSFELIILKIPKISKNANAHIGYMEID